MKPGPHYRAIVQGLRIVLGRWFRTITVTGVDNLPSDRGGVLVAWHPNGLLDPALILGACPRSVVFGARHGLFRVPLLGFLMRGLGVRPIVRGQDVPGLANEDRRRQNERALDGLATAVCEGGFACLFPEGDSHDRPHPLPLKTGAARLFERARSGAAFEPVIIPVGLHYDHKHSFRSHALVAFHPPLVRPAMDEPVDPGARVRSLTHRIERALHDVVHATESWELHHLMHRARTLIRAERAHRAGADLAAPTMEERTLGFARVWEGYRQRVATHPDQVESVLDRVREYDANMRALQMKDHELDGPPRLRGPVWLLAQGVAVFLVAPPLLVVGLVVNAPAAVAMWIAGKRLARLRKDEASIKVLAGMVLLPASWGTAAVAAWYGHKWLESVVPYLPDRRALAAVTTVALGIVGGGLAIRYFNVARETARAVRVRLTRNRRTRAVAGLRRERGKLCDAVLDLARGAGLPGRVDDNGRVRAD